MTASPARRLVAARAEHLIDSLPDAVVVVDRELNLKYASAQVEHVLGWVPEVFIGCSVVELVHPDDLDLVASSLVSIGAKDIGAPIDIRVASADGAWRHFEVVGRNMLDDPEVAGILLCLRDLTRRRWTELATDSSARLKMLIEYSASIMILLDREGRVRSVSGGWTRALGHFWEDIVGRPLIEFVVPADRAAVSAEFQSVGNVSGPVHVEARLVSERGDRVIPHDLAIVKMIDDPVVEGFVVTAQDVSKLVDARGQLEHLATHDPLTGLPNRVKLSSHLRHLLAARPADHDVMVLFIDLDRFKEVNDSFGHHAGDELLIRLAERLIGLMGPSDLVSRLGGDEFVIVALRAHGDGRVNALVANCEAMITRPFLLGTTTVQLEGSIGTAIATLGDSPDTLLARADRMMYSVKAARAKAGYPSR